MTTTRVSGGNLVEPETPASPAGEHLLVLAAVGLVLRLWWIQRYPPIFGGDTVLRLVNFKYVMLSYQLPLTQAIVHYLHAVTPDPLLVRWFMSVVGAVSGIAFYLLSLQFVPRTTAFYGALLFALNPFILPLSTVPYQEILMVTGLLFGFYGAFADKPIVASVGLGVACLTRYESWLACPIIVLIYLAQRGFSPKRAVEATLLFGWAPAAWILYNGALTPPGSFAVETHLTAARFVRWAFLGYVTLRNTPLPVTALAALGIVVFLRRGLWRDPRYLALAAYLTLFLVALLFSAHGTEPDTERRVTDREAHLTLVAFSLLATLGLSALRKYQALAVMLCVAVSIWMTDRYFAKQVSMPELAISYRAAHYLDSVVTADQHVAVLAKPIDGVTLYLGKVTSTRGDEGRAAALRILNHLETTPPDFQRILVHSRLGKSQLHSYASLIEHSAGRDEVLVQPLPLEHRPEWIAEWKDFKSSNEEETELAEMVKSLKPVWSLTEGESSLAIYRLGPIASGSSPGR